MRTVTALGGPPSVRVLRAAIFTAVMTILAVFAHAAAGAMVPGVAVTGAAGLLLGAAAYPLTTRERGLPAVLAATLGAQLVLHVLFTLEMTPSCVTSGAPVTGGTAGPTAMVMGGAHPGVCATSSWLEMGSRSGAPMLALHLLAALASAWWLRRGERALLNLLRLLWPFVVRLSLAATSQIAPAAGSRWSVAARAEGMAGGSSVLRWLLVRAVPRRGPPAAAAR